ncbi:hypothetical protein ACP70R_045280 [Stipagrostis hirtigluma subsp. patula]
MSMGLSGTSFLENIQGLELQDEALQVGIRRQYRSSGNLGMLWSEEQEKIDVLNSLDCISDCTSEEDSPSVEESATTGKEESAKCHANYVRIASKQMVGIYVSVWVSRKLRCHVNNLEVASVGVGLLGYMGNKAIFSPLGFTQLLAVDLMSNLNLSSHLFPSAGINFHQHISFPNSTVLSLLPSCIWP